MHDDHALIGRDTPVTQAGSLPRRAFLARLAALGTTSALAACAGPSGGAAGGAQAAAPLIDLHHHFFAPDYQNAWLGWDRQRNLTHHPGQAGWTTARAVEDMDRSGVRTAVLSLPATPGLWFNLPAAFAGRIARTSNEFAATMVRDHPGRFGLFASLTMLDIDATLKEIEYVFDTLKADGVGLQTNYGDKWPGDRIYQPVWEELDRRRALVYVHPLVPACCANLSVGAPPAMLEEPHDTTRAVTSLLLSGTLARHRNIRWIFASAGGTVPMLAGRIGELARQRKDFGQFAPDGVDAELRRLHFDTANALHPIALAALMKLVPESQIAFGSDHPYSTIEGQAAQLRALGLPPGVLEAIGRGNAARLIPRLRG